MHFINLFVRLVGILFYIHIRRTFKQQQSRKKNEPPGSTKYAARSRTYGILTVIISSSSDHRIINYLCWAPVGKKRNLNMLIHRDTNKFHTFSRCPIRGVVSKIYLIGITAYIFIPAYISLELGKTECEHNVKVYLVEFHGRCRPFISRPERLTKFSRISLDEA